MKKYSIWVKLSANWHNFHLADKWLIIIMAILMIQTAHNLFFADIALQDRAALDVVVRTTTASIFGYFISSNFQSNYKNIQKNNHSSTNSIGVEPPSDNSPHIKARMGFSTESKETELHSGYAYPDNNSAPESDHHAQITIIAVIGIICLIFLLIVRNYPTINTTSIAALSQIRDFISGSVGFLIGQSTQHKK